MTDTDEVDGTESAFDRAIEDLDLGEMAEVEEYAGIAIDEFGGVGRPKMKLMIGVIAVLHRRSDPTYTFERAARIKTSEVEQIIDVLVGPTVPVVDSAD